MEYNSIHLIYFSPTHTSAKTAYAAMLHKHFSVRRKPELFI